MTDTGWIETDGWLKRAEELAAEGWILADLTCVDLIGMPSDPDERVPWRGPGFGGGSDDAPAGGIDSAGHRLEIVAQLRHHRDHRLRTVHVPALGDPPTVPSVTPVWGIANFLEREVFDLMGVHFEGHPNLVRILMPDEWEGHPLRKDYGVGKVPIEFVPQPFMQISGPGQAPSGEETELRLDALGQVVIDRSETAEAPQEATHKASEKGR